MLEARKGMAKEVTFAGLKDLKAFKAGKEITNSARSTFMNCQKKYQYAYVYGLAPRRASIPLLVGTLFHEELDIVYSSRNFDEAAMRTRIAAACEKACSWEGLSAQDSDDIWIQEPVTCGLVKGYVARYMKEDLKRWEILEAEGSFEAKLPGGWIYRGKKDLVIRDTKDGKTYLVEHKTAGRLDANYVAKLPMDNQILGYAWAQRETGKRFAGVVYNVSRKSALRKKQSETGAQFGARIEEDYLLNAGAYFYRETLVFSDADLDRFGAELKRFVGYIDRAQGEGYFMQNAGHCTAYGPCPYMRLCLDGVNKETLLHYRVKNAAHEELDGKEDA